MPKVKGNGPAVPSRPYPLPLIAPPINKTEPSTGSTASAAGGGPVRQQCCVVCYTNFYPFTLESDKYAENMTKNFYVSLNIKSLMGSDEGSEGDDEEEVLSLPFCGTCHTKVALMASYHIELQHLKSKYNTLRNDLAFKVVASIGKNSREGPIDSIRQQIHDCWKLTYEKECEAKATRDLTSALDQLVADPKNEPHNCGDFICCNKGKKSEINNLAMANGLMYPGNTNKSKDLTDQGKYNLATFSDMPTLTPIKKASSPNKMSNRLNFTKLNNTSYTVSGTSASKQTASLPTTKTPLFKKQVQATVPSHIVSRIRRTGSFRTGSGSPSGSVGRWKGIAEKRKLADETFSIKTPSPKKGRFENREISPDISEITSPGLRNSTGSSTPPVPTTTADGQVVYQCKFCTKYYDKASRLRRHESFVHPNSKKLQCDICKQGFSSTVAHRRHMQHQHNLNNTGSGETMHCPYCIKVFVKSSAFEAHLKAHELIRTSVKGRRSSRSSGLFGIMADVDKSEAVESKESTENIETKTKVENEIENTNLPQENIEDGAPSQELLSMSIKIKKRPNINRPFGGGRRRRKGKKKVKPVNPDAPPPQKRNRQPKPALPSEPIRKSTRQRGIVLDSGMPMYPSAEEGVAPNESKKDEVSPPENSSKVDLTMNQNKIEKEEIVDQQEQPTNSGSDREEQKVKSKKEDEGESHYDTKIGENVEQKSEVTLDLNEGKKEVVQDPPTLTSTPNTSTLDEKSQIIPSDAVPSTVDESLEEPKNSTYTLSSENEELQNDKSVSQLEK